MNTLYYLKSISHLMNQININQEEIKNPKPKYTPELHDTRKYMYQGMKIVYFNH